MISLRTALALLTALLAAAGATVAIVFAVERSHDGVPERLRACVEERGAHAVKSSEGLASARPDVLAGRRPPARAFDLGQDRGVLLQGADYAVLVVRSPTNPPLPATCCAACTATRARTRWSRSSARRCAACWPTALRRARRRPATRASTCGARGARRRSARGAARRAARSARRRRCAGGSSRGSPGAPRRTASSRRSPRCSTTPPTISRTQSSTKRGRRWAFSTTAPSSERFMSS